MEAEKVCLRCGGSALVSARLEHPIACCIEDQACHQGALHLGLKAALCRNCGHVELCVANPAQIAEPHDANEAHILQEEDF